MGGKEEREKPQGEKKEKRNGKEKKSEKEPQLKKEKEGKKEGKKENDQGGAREEKKDESPAVQKEKIKKLLEQQLDVEGFSLFLCFFVSLCFLPFFSLSRPSLLIHYPLFLSFFLVQLFLSRFQALSISSSPWDGGLPGKNM